MTIIWDISLDSKPNMNLEGMAWHGIDLCNKVAFTFSFKV